jgi:4-amino-4-deoxy-L-arabinose transferase-like glycosyltransferase
MGNKHTEHARHLPALAVLAGLVYPPFWVLGMLGAIVLSLPWAFAAAIVAGAITGGTFLYGTAILDANRTWKSSIIGLVSGCVIAFLIVIVYGWIPLPPGIARDFGAEESSLMRTLAILLFVGVSFLPTMLFHIRQQRPHTHVEQEQP